MKMAHAPPGHHSVVGRPSVGGLSFPEYVIYRGEQVEMINVLINLIYITPSLSQAYPEYLVTYLIVKPEARVDDEISAETP